MAFEDLDFDDDLDTGEGGLPEESGNRRFILFAGIGGAAIILIVICIVVYALVIAPRTNAARLAEGEAAAAQQTEIAVKVDQTKTAVALAAEIAGYTATPTETAIPDTPTATVPPTQVVAVATSEAKITATLSSDMATSTAAIATLMRGATDTVTVLTTTPRITEEALTNSGFADDVGLPALLGMAALLIVVIFLARLLRKA
ncbi:MAG: hypothetical protein AB1894_24240 [Chloroflexota bacterium]